MADQAKPFTDMAARIEKMDSEFAGAVVVVPPGDGKPIIHLHVAPDANAALFWTTLLSQVQIASAEAEQAESRGPNPYGMRR